jgi:hypothetical protein
MTFPLSFRRTGLLERHRSVPEGCTAEVAPPENLLPAEHHGAILTL